MKSNEKCYKFKGSRSKSMKQSGISRKRCTVNYEIKELFFSLMDYRNNFFISNNPDHIVEFYKGFRDRDELIEWMMERPNGAAYVHEVEGDKDVIVVIPTANFNGKFAKECRENLFRGLHIIFVESGEIPDPYFKLTHNVNIGVQKAMNYNPKWIILSSDDEYKIDDVQTLKKLLSSINYEEVDMVFTKPSKYHSAPERMAKKNILFDLFYCITNKNMGREIIKLSRKFEIEYFSCPPYGKFSRLFKKGYEYIEIQAFGIISGKWVRKVNGIVEDETFIYSGEDTDDSLRVSLDRSRVAFINYRIGDRIGSSMGVDVARGLRSIASLCYLNFKWSKIIDELLQENFYSGCI